MGTRKHTYDLSHFFCMGHSWETLRWPKISPTQRKDCEACKWLQQRGNFLRRDSWFSPTEVTLSEASWLSKCTLTKRAADTNRGYTVTVCQMCQRGSGASWAVWMAALPRSSWHFHRAPLTPTHSHPTRAMAQPPRKGCCDCGQPPTVNASQRHYAPHGQGLVLVSWSPRKSRLQLFFPPAQVWQLTWVDLGGPEQHPPAISAYKRPL